MAIAVNYCCKDLRLKCLWGSGDASISFVAVSFDDVYKTPK